MQTLFGEPYYPALLGRPTPIIFVLYHCLNLAGVEQPTGRRLSIFDASCQPETMSSVAETTRDGSPEKPVPNRP